MKPEAVFVFVFVFFLASVGSGYEGSDLEYPQLTGTFLGTTVSSTAKTLPAYGEVHPWEHYP